MTNEFEPPARYTSYHSDKTFSRLSWARHEIQNKSGFLFEYNGLQYSVGSRSFDMDDKWKLSCLGPMYEYLMPWGKGDYEEPVLTEFDWDKFDEFIETFEIEGKTVRWILEHQKEWRYKLTAEHFEKVLMGFSFNFLYRGILCNIVHSRSLGRDAVQGIHLRVASGVLYDVTQYAPTVPGGDYWYRHIGLVENAKTPILWMGPYVTVGELLDKTGFDSKTLREIFDTDYDDGAVCCGDFDG